MVKAEPLVCTFGRVVASESGSKSSYKTAELEAYRLDKACEVAQRED